MYFGASLGRDGQLAPARDKLLEVVEGVKANKVTAEELERSRISLLNSFEKVQLDTSALVRSLSEYIAMGDWRLFFLYRDRLRKGHALEDVQRVAEQYLKPANRVLGEFIPTDRPERAEIPPTPDLQSALAGYKGGENLRLGEAFDPRRRTSRSARSSERSRTASAPLCCRSRRAAAAWWRASRCTGATRRRS